MSTERQIKTLWSQPRRLIVRDVIQRNSVLTNSYLLVYYILHFVSAVTPYETARNKEIPKSEQYIKIVFFVDGFLRSICGAHSIFRESSTCHKHIKQT